MIKIILFPIICVLSLQCLKAQEVETQDAAQKKLSISGAYIMWGNRDSDHKTTLNNNVLESLSGGVVEVNTGTFYSGNMGGIRTLCASLWEELPSTSILSQNQSTYISSEQDLHIIIKTCTDMQPMPHQNY